MGATNASSPEPDTCFNITSDVNGVSMVFLNQGEMFCRVMKEAYTTCNISLAKDACNAIKTCTYTETLCNLNTEMIGKLLWTLL